ncbi:MAG TPA: glycosyltransferase [Actinomycetota bacterium]|nr:glycosyltransferase [Actinomycetota bacterium]
MRHKVEESDSRARWGRWVHPILLAYSAAILGFVWLTKDLTVHGVVHDPLFAGYSVAVVVYILARFAFSLFYRPVPDVGYRPTVSIVIPAFNEQDGIAETIRSCLDVDYPPELLEVVVVNDGSSDRTWDVICEVKAGRPELGAVDLGRNHGKRSAMAEGIRRSSGDIIVFVDSDSFLEPDAVIHIVQPFSRDDVGAVVGHADVANSMTNWLTKMQQVRYYAAFRVIKGTESLLGGSVTCASGCCSAYRRAAILPGLDDWEFQSFLGRPATFGDDRALTNRVLQAWRVVYQASALSRTTVPESLRVFLRQQLRWKKSWLRESLTVCRYFWRKHPVAALMTYASIAFPLVAPFVVVRAVAARVVSGQTTGLWFYLIGTYAMALLYSLYYAVRRRSGLWHHGLSFVAIYMTVLVFQTYWAMFTMRDNRWGTRASSVHHDRIDPDRMTVLPAQPDGPARTSARVAVAHPRVRSWTRQAVAGLLMLPMSTLPFGAYFHGTDEGAILWAKAATSIAPPTVGGLDERETAWARHNAPTYEGPVALLVYHGVGTRPSPTTVSPQAFVDQMSTLAAAGMNTVTAEEVALWSVGLYRLPPRAVMVSFDDGRTDALLYGDIVLSELGMRATMFAISKAADEPGIYYSSWEELAAYAASRRWDIQSHTTDLHREHSTTGGRSLPALTSVGEGETVEGYAQRVRSDLSVSIQTITERAGRPPVAFAFPFGAYGGRYDDRQSGRETSRILDRAVRERFAVSFNQDDQATWRLATCADDPHRLRRLEVGEWPGRELLERIRGAADQTQQGADCERAVGVRTGGEGMPRVAADLRAGLLRLAKDRPPPPHPAPRSSIAASAGDAVSGCAVAGAECSILADVERLIEHVERLNREVVARRTSSRPSPSGAGGAVQPSSRTAPLALGSASGGASAPPRSGGGTVQPPSTGGGGSTKPPSSGGGSSQPPSSGGGGSTKPPSSGGGSSQPPSKGGGGSTKPPSSGGDGSKPPSSGSGSTRQPSNGGGPGRPASSSGSPGTGAGKAIAGPSPSRR